MLTDRKAPVQDGNPVDLIVSPEEAGEIKAASRDWPSWDLSSRQLCDIELLLNGGFTPLTGFMGRADYESVVSDIRLVDGTPWTIPIVLDLPDSVARDLAIGHPLALRDPEGVLIAVLHVEEIWKPDRLVEAAEVYRSTDEAHRGVQYLLRQTNDWYVGGRTTGIRLPEHDDSRSLRLSPARLRREFRRLGWRKIIAFQTRNPMHRAHFELTMRALRQYRANLLIHPVAGMTKPGDVDHYTRVRCYQAPAPPLSTPFGPAGPATPVDAIRRAAFRPLACHHPEKLWLHPSDCRAGPRKPGSRFKGRAILRPLRSSGAALEA